MKKLTFALILTLAAIGCRAQSFMVVNTQKIFNAIPSYVQAATELDTLASQEQRKIDNAYRKIEEQVAQYQQKAAQMTEAQRQSQEEAIFRAQQRVEEYENEMFGQNGTMIRKRIETLKPTQEKVFGIIDDYAKSNGFELVLDIASNPTVLYYSASKDKSDEIIKLIK